MTIRRICVACWISKATHAHADTHASGQPHARTRARARTYTHRKICNTYCFSTATTFCERASMLRYTYIVCLVHVSFLYKKAGTAVTH